MTDFKPVPRQILDLPLPDNDSGAKTVRGYLIELLRRVWQEEGQFSGKAPFGNAGWPYVLYRALVVAGLVDGTLDDEHGSVDKCDVDRADELIDEAIWALGAVDA